MQRGRFILAAVLALVAASAQAAAPPIVSTDFTLQDMKRLPYNWTFNGNAGFFLNPQGTTPQLVLALTKNDAGNASAVWTNDTFQLPSFTMWADVNIDFHPKPGLDQSCPADGLAMAFANTAGPDVVGGGGGAIGLFGNGDRIPQFIGFEVNTWYGQDVDDTSTCSTNKNVTFAFEDVNSDTGYDRGTAGDEKMGGDKVAQVTAPDALQGKGLVNGGWYRYQWDADTTTGKMDAYITGLDASNKAIQNMKLDEVTLASTAPKINFKGRFGLTAGTGGGTQGTRVSQVVIVSPAVPPGTALPTAGQ